MYRLINISTTPLRKYCRLGGSIMSNTSENSSVTLTRKACLLCGQLNTFSRLQLRRQSTNASLSENEKKTRKNRSKSNKKYVEMLIVTDKSSKEKKANVQKLTPAEMGLLANTSLNLNELYKLKDNKFIEEHTYNNLAILEPPVLCTVDLEAPKPPPDPPQEATITLPKNNLQNLIFNNNSPSTTFQPDIEIEEAEQEFDVQPTTKPYPKKVLTKLREEVVIKTLTAFMDTCNLLKKPQKGLNALYCHQKRIRQNTAPPFKDINVYNTLLKGFASRGDYDKCQSILEIVRNENLSLNVQSFVILFECLGRANIQNNYLKDIRILVKEAQRQRVTFDRIMNEGVFFNDERDIVLEAIKAASPDYQVDYKLVNLTYKNHLVDRLNIENHLDVKIEEQQGGLFTEDFMKKSIQKQIDLEKSGNVIVKSIEIRDSLTEDVQFFRKNLEDHYKMWEEAAYQAFTRDLATLTAQRSAINYEPYIRCLPVKEYVTIIVEEAKHMAQGSETYSPSVNMLYGSLGMKVYAKYKVLRKQKAGVLNKILDVHEEYCGNYAKSHGLLNTLPTNPVQLNNRQLWQITEFKHTQTGSSIAPCHAEWAPSVLQFVGKFLYHIVMHDLKIDVNSLRVSSKNNNRNYLPAFYTIFRNQGRLIKEEVKPHPVLSKLYRQSVPETLSFPVYELPMLCPPVPWTGPETGGYLVAHCDFVRLPSTSKNQKVRMASQEKEQLYPSFDALNQLGSVPWKVNQSILNVIVKVFTTGGSSKLDVPEPPSSLTPPPSSLPGMDSNERFKIFRQKLQYRRKKSEMYSLWCDCLYRLSLANHFRNDIFWLPHNMDFRGRAYPVPPHLSHLGSDLARSMLVFAEGRPLGPEGLNWLKIHLINLTGLKKREPVKNRLEYANSILDTILDSADNPLDGKKWWMESDEPWQTLACCMEIANAVRSENPEEFRCHFPVHQDGSCNGLQHYAALGRDKAGAISVNLAPSEEPQDVYSSVAILVEELRQKDADAGLEVAKVLEGFVRRKVIKQTVMTTVYGVTRFGARLQIARQLKDIDEFPKDMVWAASHYLTARTFDSLRSMFTSTREIQDWFTECARLISQVGGQHVEWVTPLGLPIVQPYFKFKKPPSFASYESFNIDTYEKPNVMKQKNAFPPNFIHSLDSSHMMLTSLYCEREGITFVSVHDCYWTHPSTVHIMNKICREQFVALHAEPILENLSVFLSDKYSYQANELSGDGSVGDLTKRKLNRVLRQLPNKGNFDINQVLESVYFFS